jgi:CO dehydrogenase nickel-insertion accessory protein CooC1
MNKGVCVRCGIETTGGGAYCRKCNGWAQRLGSLLATANEDAVLLASDASLADIGRSTGVSRQAVAGRLTKARKRQQQRQAVDV